jgi:hypothetical protein
MNALGFLVIGLSLFEFQGTDEKIGFSEHDEKEYNSDSCKEQQSKGPAQTNISFTTNIRFINVFPYDFIGFRSLLKLEIDLAYL